MAIVTRGKNKGKAITINQFCNDWVTDTDGKVHKPTSLRYNTLEIQDILKSWKNKTAGIMPSLYEFKGDRLIKRKPRRFITRLAIQKLAKAN